MLNLIKLCVGAQSIADLEYWRDLKIQQSGFQYHITRMFPKRKDELLNGGSLYWVIKGQVLCRQTITDLREIKGDDGKNYCQIILSPDIITTQRRAHRPFQGWRYLPQNDIPPDALSLEEGESAAQLAELGLI
jgi:hypothetical protein